MRRVLAGAPSCGADELPMIYGSCVFVFALQKERATAGLRGAVLILALLLFSIGVTVSYLDHQNAIFHEVSYGILVSTAVCAARTDARRWRC